ncbi:MAG: ribose 5-phosphate isomerase B [Pseudomonadota bacterium]|nr:ribose 5-phosphate isomerase B [Pseudomonadota bacterium]
MVKTIAMGADHAGFPLKEAVKAFLADRGWRVIDQGTDSEQAADYADFAAAVAREIVGGGCERGVLICGSGAGMVIAANKFPGIRATLCLNEEMARLSRLHNDGNILVLAGRMTDPATAERIVTTWLRTPFEGGRHQRRIDKVRAIEVALAASHGRKDPRGEGKEGDG